MARLRLHTKSTGAGEVQARMCGCALGGLIGRVLSVRCESDIAFQLVSSSAGAGSSPCSRPLVGHFPPAPPPTSHTTPHLRQPLVLAHAIREVVAAVLAGAAAVVGPQRGLGAACRPQHST